MKTRPVWLGIVLIVVGVAMLLDHLHFFAMSWWLVFWAAVTVASAVMVFRNSRRREGGVFWLTILFFFALYKTLRQFGALDLREEWGFPVLLVIAGIGIGVVVASHPHRWHLLVPALALIAAGGAMMLAEFNVLSVWDVRNAVSNYWPVAVLLFGVAMLLNGFAWKKGKTT